VCRAVRAGDAEAAVYERLSADRKPSEGTIHCAGRGLGSWTRGFDRRRSIDGSGVEQDQN